MDDWRGAVLSVPGRDNWDAFRDGGPRKRDGGGSRTCLGLDNGDCG